MREVFDWKAKVLKENPLNYLDINYEDPQDLRIIDDTRQFMLYYSGLCFEECVSLNYVHFTAYEKNCVRKCLNRSREAMQSFLNKP